MEGEVRKYQKYIDQAALKNSDTKNSDFRIRAKSLFLTYCIPKADEAKYLVTKENFIAKLYDRLQSTEPIPYILLARESYKDREDAFHYHCVVVFGRTRLFRSSRFADIEYTPVGTGAAGGLQPEQRKQGCVFHGNYMATRNLSRALTYAKKEHDFIEEGHLPEEPDEERAKKQKLSDEVAEHIRKGGSVSTIAREYPGFALQNLHKCVSFKHFVENSIYEDKIPWDTVLKTELPQDLTSGELEVVAWFKANIMQYRPLRQKQLWIKGPIGCGKTTFATLLDRFLRLFTMIYETEYMEGYEPNMTDLCILDEFRGQKTLTFLNSFIDGSIKKYNVKYSYTTKRKNHPVIFMSNFSPTECYAKANDLTLDAFCDRLTIVEITNLYGLCRYLQTIIDNNVAVN